MDETNNTTYREHTNNVNHFGCLVNLAFTDGAFTVDEFEMLTNFALKLRLTDAERNMVLDKPEAFTLKVIEPLSKQISYIYDFFKIIYADHRLNETEYHLVIKYVEQLGFNHVRARAIVNKSVELFENDINREDYESTILSQY